MKNIQATDRSRAIFNSLRKRPGVVTTQSYLRLEQTLGTQGQVNFNVLVNDGQADANERRLAITDAFTVTSLAVVIYKQAAAPAKISAGVLDTFPNPLIYTAAGEAAALQGLYNGFLSVRVNSVVYIDSLDVYRFYRVGVAQAGVETTTTPSGYVQSEYSRGDYPFYSLTPGIRLSGATKNELSLTLPESVAMGGAGGTTNRVVLYLRGFLEQNGAQFQPAKIFGSTGRSKY